jgi:ubiquinone/menaquinone biosynthesis C-methylase UbiE
MIKTGETTCQNIKLIEHKELKGNLLYNINFIKYHFDSLSKDYWMSDVFSFNLMSYWRKKAIEKIDIKQGDVVYDIMSGTGNNFAFLSQKVGDSGCVLGLDISNKMNEIAQLEIEKKQLFNVKICEQDFLKNDLKTESADVIICSFGLKTLPDNALNLFVSEIKRVLKPNGKFVLIELSEPPNYILKLLTILYLKHIVPFLSKILRGSNNAHTQLYTYFSRFKNCDNITQSLLINGLVIRRFSLSLSLITGVWGKKDF